VLYDHRAQPIVSAWKERGRRDLAPFLAEVVADVVARPAVDLLVPVPGDRERGRERGHAPAGRLADALGSFWGLPVSPLLGRTRPVSRRQAGLPRAERGANVRDAFVAVAEPPPRVAVVDDVYTTGATASACAAALRRASACRVEVVCLARAVR
jgi:predicted amidophosphoribosyltransferase